MRWTKNAEVNINKCTSSIYLTYTYFSLLAQALFYCLTNRVISTLVKCCLNLHRSFFFFKVYKICIQSQLSEKNVNRPHERMCLTKGFPIRRESFDRQNECSSCHHSVCWMGYLCSSRTCRGTALFHGSLWKGMRRLNPCHEHLLEWFQQHWTWFCWYYTVSIIRASWSKAGSGVSYFFSWLEHRSISKKIESL